MDYPKQRLQANPLSIPTLWIIPSMVCPGGEPEERPAQLHQLIQPISIFMSEQRESQSYPLDQSGLLAFTSATPL